APLGLYRVVRASGVRGRLAAAAVRGLTPFVGRERELQTLVEAWERAREGEGQVVLVGGEAGVGKSRLGEGVKAGLAGRPHTWVESGGAAYYQTTPFHVVIDLLQPGFGGAADLPAEARLDALDQALAVVGLKPANGHPAGGAAPRPGPARRPLSTPVRLDRAAAQAAAGDARDVGVRVGASPADGGWGGGPPLGGPVHARPTRPPRRAGGDGAVAPRPDRAPRVSSALARAGPSYPCESEPSDEAAGTGDDRARDDPGCPPGGGGGDAGSAHGRGAAL